MENADNSRPLLIMFFNPLPDMQILGFSNSEANKDDVKNMNKWVYNYLTE